MVAVPGEIENVPFDEVFTVAVVPPPQPTSTKMIAKLAAERNRNGVTLKHRAAMRFFARASAHARAFFVSCLNSIKIFET